MPKQKTKIKPKAQKSTEPDVESNVDLDSVVEAQQASEEACCVLDEIDDCLSCVEEDEEDEEIDPRPDWRNYYSPLPEWVIEHIKDGSISTSPEAEEFLKLYNLGRNAYEAELSSWYQRNDLCTC